MKPSSNAKALVLTLGAYVVCDILLTPVGFETRPVGGITTLGLSTLILIFLGLALIVTSVLLSPRNPRRSSVLAIIGLVLYFPAFVADRTGLFASTTSPSAITVVEIIQAFVATVGVLLALRFYREPHRPSSRATAPNA